jgi:hypothetical protein
MSSYVFFNGENDDANENWCIRLLVWKLQPIEI